MPCSALEHRTHTHPDEAQAWYEYGRCLGQQGRLPEASAALLEAQRLQPHSAPVLQALGTAMFLQNRFHEALAAYQDCVQQQPDNAQGWAYLGRTRQALAHWPEADQAFQHARQLAPEQPEYAWGHAQLLLLLERWQAGWQAYRAGLSCGQRSPCPGPLPDWRGEDADRVFVSAEQGLGDQLFFLNALPRLLARAKHWHVQLDPRLLPLYQHSWPQVAWQSSEMALPWALAGPASRQLAMADVLAIAMDHADNGPWPASLTARPADLARTAALLPPPAAGLRIGFSWVGGKQAEVRALRSLPLAAWQGLWQLPGCQWLELQYGDTDAEWQALPSLPGHVHRLPALDRAQDQAGLAACIQQLDLVITIDNSIAHLAAALGKAVWLLLPHVPEWRWGLHADHARWYPQLRLFRQPEAGDWSAVLHAVQQALAVAVSQQQALQGSEQLARAGQWQPAQDCLPNSRLGDAVHDAMVLQRGRLSLHTGQTELGQQCAMALTTYWPVRADGWHLLGLIRERMGQHHAALAALQQAHARQPEQPAITIDLCRLLLSQQQAETALALLQELARCLPNDPIVSANLASTLVELKRLDEAEPLLLQAVQQQPEQALLHLNLGVLRHEQGRPEQALLHYQQALQRAPQLASVHDHLASSLATLDRHEQALPYSEQALSLEPHNAVLRGNHAMICLALGDLNQGWQDYDAALDTVHRRRPHLTLPYWQGESLQGRHLLVTAEQGLGDMLLFSSCLGDVLALAASVTLETEPRLQPVMRALFPALKLLDRQADDNWLADLSPYHYTLPLGSLPRRVRSDLSAFARPTQPLVLPEAAVQHWRDQLPADGRPRIGIAWRSSQMQGERAFFHGQLAQCLPLLQAVDAHWICLQYDDCQAECRALQQQHGISLWQAEGLDQKNDLLHTLALMQNLDLIITTGSSVMDMAGISGTASWWLAANHSWKCLGSDHMPWYPRMRCFFSQPAGHLDSAIGAAARALAQAE